MFPTTIVRRATGVAAAGILTFGLVACGDDTSSDSGSTVPSGTESVPEQTSTTGSTSSRVESSGDIETLDHQPAKNDLDLRKQEFRTSPQDAVNTASNEVGDGGTVHAIELDHSDSAGGYVWVVKILLDGTDHKISVDAVSGEVVDQDSEPTSDEEQPISLDDPMTVDEAMALATMEVDGPVREWKLEYDDNIRAYQFDIAESGGTDTTEVTVNVDNKNVTVD